MVKLEATDQAVINLLSEASEPWTELRLIKGETHDVELAEVKLAIRDLGSQELPDAEYDARLAELRAERDRLEALPSIPDEWIQTDTGQTVGQHWASLDWDGKRAMLIENVKVRANRAENAHYQTIRVESRLFKSDLEPWITFSDQPMNLPPGWWHPHDWHD